VALGRKMATLDPNGIKLLVTETEKGYIYWGEGEVICIYRKRKVSRVEDINEQVSTEGAVLYTFVRFSLTYTITSHHKPSNSHLTISESFKFQKYFQPIHLLKNLKLLQFF
jgi:hypothetical protein